MRFSSIRDAILCVVCCASFYQQYVNYQLGLDIEYLLQTCLPQSAHSDTSPLPVVPTFEVKPGDARTVGGLGLRKPGEHRQDTDIYGGVGDEVHLGGFTVRDNDTISENLWNYMMGLLTVKSFLDIGCGKGISSRYFLDRGARVLCVEGSHDAIRHSLLPPRNIIHHDYQKGAWWPKETFDVAYSTEFIEHVGREYVPHYLATMKRAALVMVTHSVWGGYHHVEVHDRAWWIARFTAQGLLFSAELTASLAEEVLPGTHGLLLKRLLVFVNPAVASLPKHRHLFGGHGCFNEDSQVQENRGGGLPCQGKDALPPEFEPLLDCHKNGVPAALLNTTAWNCHPNPRRARIRKGIEQL